MDAHSEKLLAHILRTARVASLGTLRNEAPVVSQVAFIASKDFSAFYIHLSRLAQYAVDMQKDQRAALLISEPDDGRANLHTLASVSILGKAEFIQNGEPGYTPLKKQYLARFPESAPMFEMDDYNFWRILPKGGRYVAGFGKAYNITLEALRKASLR